MSQPITLTISIDEEGQVQVKGPIHDKMFCYALLENARDAVKDYNDARKPKILPPDPVDVFALSKRNHQ